MPEEKRRLLKDKLDEVVSALVTASCLGLDASQPDKGYALDATPMPLWSKGPS
jgi:hypothetical protein